MASFELADNVGDHRYEGCHRDGGAIQHGRLTRNTAVRRRLEDAVFGSRAAQQLSKPLATRCAQTNINRLLPTLLREAENV